MISENATITRVFKTGLRSMLSGISFLLYYKFNQGNSPARFEYKNILALGLYYGYLFLGFASWLWTTDLAWSMLQVAMDIECVVFVWFYWKALLAYNHNSGYRKEVHLDYIIWVSVAWISLVFIIGSFTNPDLFLRGTHGGEVHRLGGFIINPNELGMLTVVGAGCLYVNLFRSKLSVWKVLGWAAMVVALVLTQSRSSMISFFLTSGFFVFASGKAQLIVPSLVTGVLLAPVIFFNIFVKQGDVGEVMSMTGRLPFWKDLLTYGFPERPMYGFGFMRIHYFLNFPSIHAYPGAMTHNTFMQVLLNLGIMGALTVFFQMIFTFRAFFRQTDKIMRFTGVGIFIAIFVNSMTEFGIFGDANYGIMWWLFIIHMYVIEINPKPIIKHEPVYRTECLV